MQDLHRIENVLSREPAGLSYDKYETQEREFAFDQLLALRETQGEDGFLSEKINALIEEHKKDFLFENLRAEQKNSFEPPGFSM